MAMCTSTSSDPSSSGDEPLPTLATLGVDLLTTSPRQRRWALLRPFVGVFAFAAVVRFDWWLLTPLVMFLIFVAVVTATHDIVHNALGLGKRATDVALFALGAVLLESGHAYRLTHLQHHRVFPGPDDPEGEPAKASFLRAVLAGPLFLPRLWRWALRRSRGAERVWLIAEATWFLLAVLAAVASWPSAPGFSLYVFLAMVGSWVYPLLTVHLPHHDYGDTPLTQTRTLRGVVIPKLFLELTYHLEHHLYPQVPSHHLPELSRRLEPVFRAAGVDPVRVL